jgi:signal transduction histidine kinase
MKIKNRLSLYFTATSVFVLLVVEVAISLAVNSIIKSGFYDQLTDRATVAAQVYLEADEISADSLSHVRERYLLHLPNEVVRFYDDKDEASFIKDKNQYWPTNVINLVRKQKRVQFAEGERQTVGIYYNDNQGNFVILVSAIDHSGNKRLKDLLTALSVLLLIVTIALFLSSRWFAEKTLEPIGKVVDQMQRVSAGNLSLRVDEGSGKDEISALAHNFNRLLEHLENAFELQQTFVINASHELRTPITSIIGEIELALTKARNNEEYEQVLKSVFTDAERLKETVTSLLELALADMNYTQPNFKPIPIDELIWELSEYWNTKIGKGRFLVNILHLPDDPDKLLIPAHKQLLTIALNNIIGNAYKFSDNQQVKCGLYVDDNHISITVSDLGIGIPANELESVFDSFYRGTNVKGYMGSGIGLYVTSKIITLFNGDIAIKSEAGIGTSIIVTFKKRG